jgi:asparagine synthase (glutamine-hydrolysing)
LQGDDPISVQYQNRIVVSDTATTQSGFPVLTTADERRTLIGKEFPIEHDEDAKLEWLDCARNPLQRATAADITTWLPDDLLIKLDRMGMAHSLEGRAPYLQPDLVALGLRLPEPDRMAGDVSKVALRRIGRRYLPQRFLVREKHGFILPMRQWVQDWFSGYGGPEHYFRSRPIPHLDNSQLNRMVTAGLEQGRERLLFALILFAEWWHSFQRQRDSLRHRIAMA